MRTTLGTVAVICIALGTIWFLQGINLLPGSFMTGQTEWAVYGGALFLLGIVVLFFARRKR